MTKKEFIDLLQDKAQLKTKAETEKVLDAFMESVKVVLTKGEELTFVGFGKFEVVEKAERAGRNPSTGAEMVIPAKKVVKFKAGKALADAVAK